MRLRMVTFDLQAPPTSPLIGHAKMSSRRIPSTDLEGTRGGILDPTPIHYLGTDHTDGNTSSLSGQV